MIEVEGVCVVYVSTRHTSQAKVVLREEGKVHAEEEECKLNTTHAIRQCLTYDLLESVEQTCEDTEDRAHRQYVVKVRNNVVGIVQSNVQATVRQNDSCHATDRKEKKET